MIVAHRGNAAEFRENSVQAIRSALELGVKWVEIDVQLSSDHVPMLSHDASLERLFGIKQHIGDKTSYDLQSLGVTTLVHAVEAAKQYRAELFVELKSDSLDRFGDRVIAETARIASDHVLISFSLEAVLKARRAYGCRIGWIVPNVDESTRKLCQSVDPDYLFCDQLLIPRAMKLWPAQWVAYEVESKVMADELAACGVTMFETKNVRAMCSQ